MVGALVISSLVPDRYKATASIVKQVTTGPYESVNVDALTRELSTIEQLLLTSDVLDRAAQRVERREPGLGPGGARVERRPRGQPHLRHRHGRRPEEGRPDRQRGRRDTFIATQRDLARKQYEQARAGLAPGAQASAASPAPRSRSRRSSSGSQRARRLAGGRRNGPAGGPARHAARASAARPSPLRNGVIALFLGLFLGVLVALASDQLVPRVTGTRELAGSWTCRCSATVPYVRKRLAGGRRAADRDGVRELPDARHVGALRAAGGVGPACRAHHERAARRGQDHRRRAARPHARAGGPPDAARLGRPALADAARAARHAVRARAAELLAELETPRRRTTRSLRGSVSGSIAPVESASRHGELDVLPSGRKPDDPGAPADRDGLDARLRRHRGARLRLRDHRRAAAARHRRHPGARPLRRTACSSSRASTASRSTT